MSNYKLCVYIPEAALETVKQALFEAGAGQIGEYSHCGWQTLGTGQFKPSENANPTIGSHNQIEQVIEYKFETICEAQAIEKVINSLKASHPYETPAYDVYLLENF